MLKSFFLENNLQLGFIFGLFLVCMTLFVSPSYANVEELNDYFEIRDTIMLMNDEMMGGIEMEGKPSMFDEPDVDVKIESFISFMKSRVASYKSSDSKLKFIYVRKLDFLLEETQSLYLQAKPIIKAKQDKKQGQREKVVSPMPSEIISQPDSGYTEPDKVADRKDLANKGQEESKPIGEIISKIEEPADDFALVVAPKETVEQALPKKEKKVVTKPEGKIKDIPVTVDKISEITEKDTKTEAVATYAEKGFMRPMAIMVENHNQARPQSGLYLADILYEMPVEGGITRFMALFTKMPGLIGPVRSCREYFVDRALEVDALYVHCGGSPMGYAYLSKSRIRSVDEIKNASPFFRDKIRKAPHNLYGRGKKIYDYMKKRTDMRVDKELLPLNYGKRGEVGGDFGEYLKINYHSNYSLIIKYENGVYRRYMNDILHLDRETKKPLEASALILQVAAMKTVDDIGRQEISFIGSGTAWIFENGLRTKVSWKKDTPRSKTLYFDEKGKEYLFNRNGQVWVLVVSPKHKTFFEQSKKKD